MASQVPRLPRQPIDRLVDPLGRFLHIEAASGVVLVLCTAVALAVANSPWGDAWAALWHTEVALRVGEREIEHSLVHWINDALMAVFFFVVGLEVKRELVLGELRDPRRAALPLAGALGGMLVPALIYLALQFGEPGESGWGVPMATDIAFVVGCMALQSRRVPLPLRTFLLTLAIADDIGAILVIAIGYTEDIHLPSLAVGLVGLVGVHLLARVGVRSFLAYILAGLVVWGAFLSSGVHPTIAGVALGLLTPARPHLGASGFQSLLDRAGQLVQGGGWESTLKSATDVKRLQAAVREIVSPLEYLEHVLHPWVGFGIMPLFALANAGVAFELGDLAHPIAIAVAAGLVLGKPIGVVGTSWIAVRLGLARLPANVGWRALVAAGCLSGIGFTMALFIASLALEEHLLDVAKVGVLAGSVVSAVIGMALVATLPPRPT